MGIPTNTSRPGEVYLEEYGMHVSGFETSPFGVEWMRFEPGSPVSELIRTVPHIAFEVDNLEAALEGAWLRLGPDQIADEPVEATVLIGVAIADEEHPLRQWIDGAAGVYGDDLDGRSRHEGGRGKHEQAGSDGVHGD